MRHLNLRYIHIAQDGENIIAMMQEMRCRKRNVDTHTLWVSGVREGEEKNTWQGPDGTGPHKRSEAEWHCSWDNGMGMLNGSLE